MSICIGGKQIKIIPLPALLNRKCLCVARTSVESEKLLSADGNIHLPKRNHLQAETGDTDILILQLKGIRSGT